MYVIISIRENGMILPPVACKTEREVSEYMNLQALYLGYVRILTPTHFSIEDIHYRVYKQLQPS